MDVVPTAVKTAFRYRAAGAVLAVAAVILTAACSAPAEPTRSAAPFSNTFDSPEALAQAVLNALAARDLARLRSLALSEAEFRDHVWPELPTSRPERNVPFDYAWGQMKQRSDGSLQETFNRYAGRQLKFIRAGFTGETTTYPSFVVRRDSEVIAADETGRTVVLRLYGAVLIKNGQAKMFSYVVDD